jgi:predicted XRE-type DNA-binding protein
MKYPKNEDIESLLKDITDDDFIDILPQDATGVEKTKFELCKKLVTYLRENNISQAELARQIHVDRSRVNWIVKYKIDNFTIDKLYELWSLVDPSFELKVS